MRYIETKTRLNIEHPDYVCEFDKKKNWRLTRFASSLRPTCNTVQRIGLEYGFFAGKGQEVVYVREFPTSDDDMPLSAARTEVRARNAGLCVQIHSESDHFYFSRRFDFFAGQPQVRCQCVARKKPVSVKGATPLRFPVVEVSPSLIVRSEISRAPSFDGAALGDGFESPPWRVIWNRTGEWGLVVFTADREHMRAAHIGEATLCFMRHAACLGPEHENTYDWDIGGEKENIAPIEANEFFIMPFEKTRWRRDRRIIECFCMKEIAADAWVETYPATYHPGGESREARRVYIMPDCMDVRYISVPQGVRHVSSVDITVEAETCKTVILAAPAALAPIDVQAAACDPSVQVSINPLRRNRRGYAFYRCEILALRSRRNAPPYQTLEIRTSRLDEVIGRFGVRITGGKVRHRKPL